VTPGPRLFASVPIPLGPDGGADFARADITVEGLDHGDGSYEVRVFLNNPDADPATPLTAEEGYAGSVYVYGYGKPPPASDAAVGIRPSRSIIATDALRAQLAKVGDLSVTLVLAGRLSPGADVDLGSAGVSVQLS
jgi:hypothetical protein